MWLAAVSVVIVIAAGDPDDGSTRAIEQALRGALGTDAEVVVRRAAPPESAAAVAAAAAGADGAALVGVVSWSEGQRRVSIHFANPRDGRSSDREIRALDASAVATTAIGGYGGGLGGVFAFRLPREQSLRKRFAVESGSFFAKVAKLGPDDRFVVSTPDAEVEVRGTAVRVTIVPGEAACAGGTPTRLDVTEGVVVVRHAGAELRVAAGQRWPVCDPPAAPVALPAARSSSSTAASTQRAAASAARPRVGGAPAAVEVSSRLAEQNDLFDEAMRLKRGGEHRSGAGQARTPLERLSGRPPRGERRGGAHAPPRLVRATPEGIPLGPPRRAMRRGAMLEWHAIDRPATSGLVTRPHVELVVPVAVRRRRRASRGAPDDRRLLLGGDHRAGPVAPPSLRGQEPARRRADARCGRGLASDVSMPGMSGVEVAAAFRRLRPGVPDLYVSGKLDEPGVREDVTSARAALLAKPFARVHLLAAVTACIDSASSAH